ncbi:MAG: EAL domain-containing protein [Pseudomonadota bacterium]
MKRVLLINPSASRRAGIGNVLQARGYQVQAVVGFSAGIAALTEVDSAGSDLVGVVVGWPDEADDPASFHAFLNKLGEHTHQHVAVLLMCNTMSSQAVGWLKYRKRSAMLLWSDYSEVPDALGRLLDPHRERRISHLEQLADQHLRVLFVDDSPTVRIAFRRLLMKYGFLVETASSVSEGYRKALQSPFDIAIIDYFMPEHNGTVLVAKLAAEPRTRHIVTAVITGTYSDTVINDSLAAGAVECIFKNEAKDLFLARIASLARNIIDRKSIDSERRRLEGILRSVGDGVYGVDSDGRIQFMNPAAREIVGLMPDFTVDGESAYELFHSRAEDGTKMPEEACSLSQCYRTGEQITAWQTTFWSQTGRMIPVECTVYPLRIEGERQGSVVAFRDVSARKLLEEELRWQATHDSLTKLSNRSHFEEELEQEVHRLKRSSQSSALLFVDLDRFKYINDTAGHVAGDRLLVEVARRLQQRLRMSDSLARIGGDEYAVILRNVHPDGAERAADQFRIALEDTPFLHDGKQYMISATIGVCLIDASTVSPGEAMANADIACHLAKMGGRNRIHLFSTESDQKAAMDMELGWSTRLRQALKDDLFVLRYQPIVPASHVDPDAMDLEDGAVWRHVQTDGPCDFEVLLRLQDAEGNLIAPDAFLPTAERFNMMVEIDRWVIESAFSAMARLAGNGIHCGFSINISEQSLLDPELVDYIGERLTAHGLSGDRVTFELAETRAMAHVDATRDVIARLRLLGCGFGLDDFGTGFASFSHLRQLDVDYLKIDGAYMRSMSKDPINMAVLGAISRIAHALGKKTIAECVDSAKTIEALKKSGIDQLQGFFIGRPQESVSGATVLPDDPKVTPISQRQVR